MKHDSKANAEHVMLNDMPKVNPAYTFNAETEERFNVIIALRNDVNKALELARVEKTIGKPLEAVVALFFSESAKAQFGKIAAMPLSMIFIVSETKVVYGSGEGYEGDEFKGITIQIEPCDAPKCIRCWMHNEHVGENAEHPELCPRCAAAVSD